MIEILVFLFLTSSSFAMEILRVSAIPDEAPSELQRKFTPLAAYLEKELSMKIEFIPTSDYAAVVTALVHNKIDLAWLGGFTFVQANKMGSVKPIIQRIEDTQFTSTFIVNTSSNIKSLNDLKGKDFAFGSPSSTSGHLMPRDFLLKSGLIPEKIFKNISYSGAHDATIAWVQSGKVPAGVLNTVVWEKLIEQKKVDLSKVKVLTKTSPYFDYNWTVRGNLNPDLIQKIKNAFLKLSSKTDEGKTILDLQRATKFIETSAANYLNIEAAAKNAGLF